MVKPDPMRGFARLIPKSVVVPTVIPLGATPVVFVAPSTVVIESILITYSYVGPNTGEEAKLEDIQLSVEQSLGTSSTEHKVLVKEGVTSADIKLTLKADEKISLSLNKLPIDAAVSVSFLQRVKIVGGADGSDSNNQA